MKNCREKSGGMALRIEGDIKNDPDEAFELMLKLGAEMGLKTV